MNVILKRSAFIPKYFASSRRTVFEYVNRVFNNPDPERIKAVGPDRACAEWALRNGGRIIWADGTPLDNYNALPAEGTVLKIAVVDTTKSSMSHHGFGHLEGCSALTKLILNESTWIDDKALSQLHYGKETIEHLQVSKCANVTDKGLDQISILKKLKKVVLYDLENVKDLEGCKLKLKNNMPSCTIE